MTFFALRQIWTRSFSEASKYRLTRTLKHSGQGKARSTSKRTALANYEGATVVGDHFVVFLSDKQRWSNNAFFMQEYGDRSLEPIGSAYELASYELESKRRRFAGAFSMCINLRTKNFSRSFGRSLEKRTKKRSTDTKSMT